MMTQTVSSVEERERCLHEFVQGLIAEYNWPNSTPRSVLQDPKKRVALERLFAQAETKRLAEEEKARKAEEEQKKRRATEESAEMDETLAQLLANIPPEEMARMDLHEWVTAYANKVPGTTLVERRDNDGKGDLVCGCPVGAPCCDKRHIVTDCFALNADGQIVALCNNLRVMFDKVARETAVAQDRDPKWWRPSRLRYARTLDAIQKVQAQWEARSPVRQYAVAWTDGREKKKLIVRKDGEKFLCSLPEDVCPKGKDDASRYLVDETDDEIHGLCWAASKGFEEVREETGNRNLYTYKTLEQARRAAKRQQNRKAVGAYAVKLANVNESDESFPWPTVRRDGEGNLLYACCLPSKIPCCDKRPVQEDESTKDDPEPERKLLFAVIRGQIVTIDTWAARIFSGVRKAEGDLRHPERLKTTGNEGMAKVILTHQLNADKPLTGKPRQSNGDDSKVVTPEQVVYFETELVKFAKEFGDKDGKVSALMIEGEVVALTPDRKSVNIMRKLMESPPIKWQLDKYKSLMDQARTRATQGAKGSSGNGHGKGKKKQK